MDMGDFFCVDGVIDRTTEILGLVSAPAAVEDLLELDATELGREDCDTPPK